MAYIAMTYIVTAYIVVAYIVMADIVMAYIVMALVFSISAACEQVRFVRHDQVLLCLLVFLIFAILGTNLFKGKFFFFF